LIEKVVAWGRCPEFWGESGKEFFMKMVDLTNGAWEQRPEPSKVVYLEGNRIDPHRRQGDLEMFGEAMRELAWFLTVDGRAWAHYCNGTTYRTRTDTDFMTIALEHQGGVRDE
jgi:hypothetical protein